MYWKIEPHDNKDYDYCVMPARNEVDHRKALEYAQARLEKIWDELKPGNKGTVSIELCDGEEENKK